MRDVCGILSDCFVVPGVLLAGIGGLSWIAGQGAFDLIGYYASRLTGGGGTFFEYKRRMADKRVWHPRTLLGGLGCLAVSVIFLILYLYI